MLSLYLEDSVSFRRPYCPAIYRFNAISMSLPEALAAEHRGVQMVQQPRDRRMKQTTLHLLISKPLWCGTGRHEEQWVRTAQE